MRKFISILSVGLVLCSASAYAGISVIEDFNSYASGTNALNNPALGHSALGGEVTSASIVGDDINNSIQINFTSDASATPFSFGVIQSNRFATDLDLTVDGMILFDIKTDLSQSWSDVLSAQLLVNTWNPSSSTWSYQKWRLQDTLGQVYGKTNQPLLDLPQTDWTTISINAADLVFHSSDEFGNGGGQHWLEPDFAQVAGVDIVVLQTVNNIQDTGTVLVDNIQLSGQYVPDTPVPEPGAMLLCGLAGLYTIIRKKIRK